MTAEACGPLLGVVTVTFNSEKFLGEFCDSCAQQDFSDFAVYCIDNRSKDGTPARLQQVADPRWRVTLNECNVGVAAGNNQGIAQALRDGCEWILLLNNDTSFPRTFLSDLMNVCATRGWSVAVPKIFYDTPPGRLWYAGGGFSGLKGFTGYHTAFGVMDHDGIAGERLVEYAPTCAMLVHRSVFARVGLMDESYFVYFDDTDFCWRLKQAGVAIGYTPTTHLIHKVGGSTGGGASAFSAEMLARNRLYFLRKHFGDYAPLLWAPMFLSYYVVRYLVREWNPAVFRACIRGTVAYRSLRPHVPLLRP